MSESVKQAEYLRNINCCSWGSRAAVEAADNSRYKEWIEYIDDKQKRLSVKDTKTHEAWDKTFETLKLVNGFVEHEAAKNILYCCLPICLDFRIPFSSYTHTELSNIPKITYSFATAWNSEENIRIRNDIEHRISLSE